MTSYSPRVSVILPTYNRAHLLPRAIASVLGQSFRDFELIIVDDASSDDTQRVVESFRDPRITFVRAAQNGGDAAARNLGVSHAQGDWLAFQDSDDEWVANKLDQQLAFARAHPQADLVGASSVRISSGQVDSHHWPLVATAGPDGGIVDIAAWVCNSIANLQAMLIRRVTFLNYQGLDTQFRAIGDSDFVFRMAQKSPSAIFASRNIVAVMYETPGSLVGRPEKISHDFRRLLTKHDSLLQKYPAAMAALWYRLALAELQCGNVSTSRKATVCAIRARPAFWRPWAYLCLSFVGLSRVQRVRDASQALRRWFSDAH